MAKLIKAEGVTVTLKCFRTFCLSKEGWARTPIPPGGVNKRKQGLNMGGARVWTGALQHSETQTTKFVSQQFGSGCVQEQKLFIYCKNPKSSDEISTIFFDVWIIPTLICI